MAASKKSPRATSGGTRKSENKRQTPRITTSHKSGAGARALPAAARPVRRAAVRERPRARPPAVDPRLPQRTKKPPRPVDVGPSLASDDARAMAILVATAALDKKAIGIELLDVAGKIDYADFIVVMTGRSDRHVQALAQGIEEELRKKGKRPLSIEGVPSARWILMDLGDVVVHVFQEDARGMYDIEGLWSDAKRVPLPENDAPPI